MKSILLRAAVLPMVAVVVGAGAPARDVLPIAQPAFDGTIAPDIANAVPGHVAAVTAPENAPNVFLLMSDDVGLAMASTFGGPVPTPNLDRIARGGVRYNQFHTTGICSPSRAALLTGRNHHNAGFGYLADLPAGFPGYMAEIPRSTASIAEILKLNGYNTAMFGKTHNVRHADATVAGPFDQWPTGQGFEYFWGIVGGDTDQYEPAIFRGTTRQPDAGKGAPMMEARMADEAIGWVHNQQAAAPDKPFFIYYAPGSTHAPHQAPREWIERFHGQFDMGWDRMREISYARMKREGIIPKTATLTRRPPEIDGWDSLSHERKLFSARAMEAAAGMLAYQDYQIGRILDELERTGEGQNLLLIMVIGDNGASAESGNAGTINELGKINGLTESDEWLAANADRMGGPMTYPAYPAGWAWAMNTPLRWTKQYTSMLGGIRNAMIMHWNDRAAAPGTICPQFGHLIDVAPTILDAAGIPAPHIVNGVEQKPMDGVSLLPSLKACNPAMGRTQYFEMGGKIGLWKDGWFASLDDGRTPWMMAPPRDGQAEWGLYNLNVDYSQANNLAAEYPEKLAEMKQVWEREAEANDVYPLEHRFGYMRIDHRPPLPTSFDYWASGVSVPVTAGPQFTGRSFTLTAEFTPRQEKSSGVIVAYGSHFAGWSLYMEEGRPVFTYARSTKPDDIVTIRAAREMKSGEPLTLRFETAGPGRPATAQVLTGKEVLAQGSMARTFVFPAGLGETLDLGRDRGVDVTEYPHGDAFDGTIAHVHVELDPLASAGSH